MKVAAWGERKGRGEGHLHKKDRAKRVAEPSSQSWSCRGEVDPVFVV